jgi:hypothetical protein
MTGTCTPTYSAHNTHTHNTHTRDASRTTTVTIDGAVKKKEKKSPCASPPASGTRDGTGEEISDRPKILANLFSPTCARGCSVAARVCVCGVCVVCVCVCLCVCGWVSVSPLSLTHSLTLFLSLSLACTLALVFLGAVTCSVSHLDSCGQGPGRRSRRSSQVPNSLTLPSVLFSLR